MNISKGHCSVSLLLMIISVLGLVICGYVEAHEITGNIKVTSDKENVAENDSNAGTEANQDGDDDDDADEEYKEPEPPLPQLKTVIQCKQDCTAEWSDCIYGCPEGKTQCFQGCQTLVKTCLDECPSVICHDHCSIELEICQRKGLLEECDQPYYDCQEICDQVYIGRTDL